MRAAGYIRVSSLGQAEDGYSLAAQRLAIERYCAARGWGAPTIYEDAGVSAHRDDIAARPAFARLIDAIEARAYEAVVVHKLDRWARSVLVTFESLRRLEAAGCAFISISEALDLTGPWGRAMLGVLAIFAQLFSDNLSTETKKGLNVKRSRGEPLGSPPYGARRDDRGMYVVDPVRAPALRRILELAPALSWDALARDLNAAGIPSPRGSVWSEGTLRRLVLRSSDWLLDQPEPWPTLVAGARDRPERPPVPRSGTVRMLTGIARCRCGGRMYYFRAHGAGRLGCRNRHDRPEVGGFGCPFGPFGTATGYHGQVTAQLLALADPEDWREGPSPDAAVELARRELAEDRRRLAATYRARLIGDAEFEAERRGLDARAAALPRAAPALVGLRGVFNDTRRAWPLLPGDAQNAFLRVLCERVAIDGKRATVEWRPELLALLPVS